LLYLHLKLNDVGVKSRPNARSAKMTVNNFLLADFKMTQLPIFAIVKVLWHYFKTAAIMWQCT